MKIIVEESTLYMYLSNGKPLQAISQKGKNGIGLRNVKERLKLLYPGQHELTIDSTADEFSVQLQLPIQPEMIKNTSGLNRTEVNKLFQNASYAN